MALTKEGTALGPLRWREGEEVECWWRSNDQPGCWLRGTVVSHWWRSEQWPEGQYAPYQVRLRNGTLIFAPRDDDSCIREAAPDLDLDPDRPEQPPPEAAMARGPQGPPPPQQESIPWRQAKTKDGKTYYYHPVTKETSWEDPDKQPRTQHRPVQHLQGPEGPQATLPERVRQAAEEGNREVVNEYLAKNAGSVDAADAQGRTLLMTAAFGGRGTEDIIYALLGPPVRGQGPAGLARSTAAAPSRRLPRLRPLPRAPERGPGGAGLLAAAAGARLRSRFTLKPPPPAPVTAAPRAAPPPGQRASPDLQDGQGASALMYACVKGRDHVATMLLQAGAAVGLQDAQGGTALHLATLLGHPPLVPRLVQTAL